MPKLRIFNTKIGYSCLLFKILDVDSEYREIMREENHPFFNSDTNFSTSALSENSDYIREGKSLSTVRGGIWIITALKLLRQSIFRWTLLSLIVILLNGIVLIFPLINLFLIPYSLFLFLWQATQKYA